MMSRFPRPRFSRPRISPSEFPRCGRTIARWHGGLTATITDMARLRRRFAVFVGKAHISMADAARIWLVVDEIIGNMRRHGRPNAPLHLLVERRKNGVNLCISDISGRFNPIGHSIDCDPIYDPADHHAKGRHSARGTPKGRHSAGHSKGHSASHSKSHDSKGHDSKSHDRGALLADARVGGQGLRLVRALIRARDAHGRYYRRGHRNCLAIWYRPSRNAYRGRGRFKKMYRRSIHRQDAHLGNIYSGGAGISIEGGVNAEIPAER